MSLSADWLARFPAQQRSLIAKCRHPSGQSCEFPQAALEQSIDWRFKTIVNQYFTRIAIQDEHGTLTYGQLDKRADWLAASLLEQSGCENCPIAVLLPNGGALMAALLGVWRAGKIVALLDPSVPDQRLASMLKRAQARIIVSDDATRSRLGAALPGFDWIDIHNLRSKSPNAGRCQARPDDAACIFFTSGSTGEPKAVVLSQQNLLHQNMLFTKAYGLSIHDRLALLSSGTGSAVTSALIALLNGAVALPFDIRGNGVAQLPSWLIEQRVSVCLLGTPLFRNLCETLNGNETFPDLRLIRLRSDSVRRHDFELFKKHFPRDCLLVNGLSSSETGLLTLCYFAHDSELTDDEIPVGYPVQDKEVFLVDEAGAPLGINQIGEIVVRSRYLSSGYWDAPDLTAAKFKCEPGHRERLCLTGDLGLMRADGCLIHKGRKDFRVKIRGYGVDVAEVEKTLGECKLVRAAAVVARQTERGEASLVAYIVPSGARPITTGALRKFMSGRMPGYMIPAAFVAVDTLPLTPNGKIDRRALPERFALRTRLDSPYAASRNETEERLTSIWQEVLGLESIGVEDNFFDLGGDSLSATRVIVRLRGLWQLDLTQRQLFEVPTIAALAAYLANAATERNSVLPPLSPRAQCSESSPLSFSQQRLWLLDQLDPGVPTYNLCSATQMTGALDIEGLQKGLTEIVRRHAVLRTVYRDIDGTPEQVIHPATPVEVAIADLRMVASEAARSAELLRLYRQEAQRPFDLTQDLLLRATLVRWADRTQVLLLTLHHIVFDGWSRGILIAELSALYSAHVTRTIAPLPRLPVQYADFALWQNQPIQETALETHRTYWKQKLAGLEPLELPADLPRKPQLGCHGARRVFYLPTQLSRQIKTLADAEGVTLFMMLLSGWQALFQRYTGQVDIAIGAPVAGRSRPEVENLIGCFLNVLVLRGDLSGDPTFRELLARARNTCLEAFDHQDFPFEKLVEDLDLKRTLDRHPLVQVMFAFQNTPKSAWQMNGLAVEEVEVDPGMSRFDLNLFVEEQENRLRISVEYNRELFYESTMERWIGHYQTLLEGILHDPDQRVSELDILPQTEREQLLNEWNQTARHYPKDKCIHELFEEQVERTPDAVAAVFEDRRLSYRELDQRANQLAHYLKKHGVGPEVLVGLCADRSLDLIVGMIGILKAGGAYVPLDPSLPKDRLAFMVADANIAIILTQRQLREQLSDGNAQLIVLDDQEYFRSPAKDKPNICATDPHHLAYVVYTSGSTGVPKGVLVTHTNLTRLFAATTQHYHFAASDVWTLFHSYAFDFSVWEIWGALLHGGRLVIVPYAISRAPDDFAQLIKQQGVTVLNQTPSAFQQLMPYLMSVYGDDKPTLRYIVFGGEALELESLRAWRDRHGDQQPRLVNMYGITECTVHVTHHLVAQAPLTANIGSPIGRPLADLGIYLLDSHRQPVPIGVAGEVYVGGAGVARGYLNRPELTAEKFVYHSFDGEPAHRLYRTGDLARYLPDGNLEFLGRMDNQVKIRGYRIELGEIESVLMQHAGVRECVVVARDDRDSDSENPKSKSGPADENPKSLVAYVVPQNEELATSELHTYLRGKLPDYMVPSDFVFLDSIPLNANGKVDRKALPKPDGALIERGEGMVAPRNAVEETIAAVWLEVLGRKPIGVHTNFFDLGGHSLTATQVVARLRARFNSEIPLRHLFEYPTIAELAAAIAAPREANVAGVDGLLAEIETMTDEEAQKELAGGNKQASDERKHG